MSNCIGRALLAVALVGLAVPAALAGSEPEVFTQKATVIDPDFDGPNCPFHEQKSGKDKGEETERPPLKAGRKFKIAKRSGIRRYIDVKWSLIHAFQRADMFRIYENGMPTTANYCVDGGDLKNHPLAFGILELKDPESDTKNPHALIYIPVNIKGGNNSYRGTEFYLLLLDIVDDIGECDDLGPKQKLRCTKLRELATLKKNGVDDVKFTEAIAERISSILPMDGTNRDELRIKYHNGVIHGSL